MHKRLFIATEKEKKSVACTVKNDTSDGGVTWNGSKAGSKADGLLDGSLYAIGTTISGAKER